MGLIPPLQACYRPSCFEGTETMRFTPEVESLKR